MNEIKHVSELSHQLKKLKKSGNQKKKEKTKKRKMEGKRSEENIIAMEIFELILSLKAALKTKRCLLEKKTNIYYQESKKEEIVSQDREDFLQVKIILDFDGRN